MAEIIKEYAEAIFMLAAENGTERDTLRALEGVDRVFKSTPEYLELLSSPAVPLSERVSAVESAFGGRIPERVVSLVQLLCEKRRVGEFSQCVEEYKKLLREKEATATAVVTSAVALTDAERLALKAKLERKSGKSIHLDCRVDTSIMGGVIVELEGKIMDGSLRHRLQELTDVIKAHP
ncbi:MAG: ATP synthase F1 subunit delta [Clostridia bacterium]|nr:ATP synthase F1 subunit delta [Clostridia bacterium]